MTLVGTAHHGGKKYVLFADEFLGKDKDEVNFVRSTKNRAVKYDPQSVKVESNNGGEIIARMLTKEDLPTDVLKTSKDKVTRLRKFEGCFTRGEVYFLPGTEALVKQLLAFPNVAHDDLVDGMVNSFEYDGSHFTESA